MVSDRHGSSAYDEALADGERSAPAKVISNET